MTIAIATRARDTMPPVRLDPSYRRELVRRIRALLARDVTLLAIARAGQITRQSLWRFLRENERHATAKQADAVRAAIMELDPSGPPIPPPVTITPTGGPGTASWRAALRADRRRR